MQLPLKNAAFHTDVSPDRREASQPPERALGRVIACDGSRATILSAVSTGGWMATDAWTIGRMISINLGQSRIVALVYKLHAVEPAWTDGENPIQVEVEFLGEVLDRPDGSVRFQSGISNYPPIGAIAHRIRAGDLALVHDLGDRVGAEIGHVTQDASIPATVSVQDMLSRHFALVGTTGVGKSSAVSLLLRRAVAVRPRLRVLILDPHNEYSVAFPDLALTIDGEALDLPFWMFKQEELADVVFRGRPALDDEPDILREVVAAARTRYRVPSGQELARDLGSSLLKRPLDLGVGRSSPEPTAAPSGGGTDASTPYRLKDAFAVIDELIGLHEQRWPRAALRSLKVRLESLHADPRYRFMFGRANMYETVAPILGQIFRIPMHGRPITAFQLGGLPGEVVNAVASVLSRLAFDIAMASQGACEVLVLCEEAHRYVPSDQALGFAPTRQAIARIAKEGRKYGAYLGVVTQRPGELDPTILSQCSTVFAMRLANERDQQIIRSAISDASASTINFLSSIGNREAIAFGEGVATTMRMRFADLKPHELPAMNVRAGEGGGRLEPTLDDMVRRMRA